MYSRQCLYWIYKSADEITCSWRNNLNRECANKSACICGGIASCYYPEYVWKRHTCVTLAGRVDMIINNKIVIVKGLVDN